MLISVWVFREQLTYGLWFKHVFINALPGHLSDLFSIGEYYTEANIK